MAKDRAWELDFLRGIALIMMLFMHMSWDVRYEFGADIFSYLEADWFWSFVHPIIVVLFVSVSGICCTITLIERDRFLACLRRYDNRLHVFLALGQGGEERPHQSGG